VAKYTWLLLDADGTLFDYDQAEAAALATTFADLELDHGSHYAEAYGEINGQIWLEFEAGEISAQELRAERFRRLFAALRVEADPLRFSRRYLVNLADRADLLEGAEELVRALYGHVGLVVITNGLRDVQRSRLAKSTISGYLHDVVISEEVGAAKPDGQIFAAAFERMGQPPKSDVLIVGDSLTSDIKGGSDYGIDTCWYNPDRLPRVGDVRIRYEIHRLSELLDIVGVAWTGH
jgi:YjjG family noncanonical pyrimidine nucleotidase